MPLISTSFWCPLLSRKFKNSQYQSSIKCKKKFTCDIRTAFNEIETGEHLMIKMMGIEKLLLM